LIYPQLLLSFASGYRSKNLFNKHFLFLKWYKCVSLCFFGAISLEEEKAKKDPKYYLNRANKDTLGILSELEKTYKEPVSPENILSTFIAAFSVKFHVLVTRIISK